MTTDRDRVNEVIRGDQGGGGMCKALTLSKINYIRSTTPYK